MDGWTNWQTDMMVSATACVTKNTIFPSLNPYTYPIVVTTILSGCGPKRGRQYTPLLTLGTLSHKLIIWNTRFGSHCKAFLSKFQLHSGNIKIYQEQTQWQNLKIVGIIRNSAPKNLTENLLVSNISFVNNKINCWQTTLVNTIEK